MPKFSAKFRVFHKIFYSIKFWEKIKNSLEYLFFLVEKVILLGTYLYLSIAGYILKLLLKLLLLKLFLMISPGRCYINSVDFY